MAEDVVPGVAAEEDVVLAAVAEGVDASVVAAVADIMLVEAIVAAGEVSAVAEVVVVAIVAVAAVTAAETSAAAAATAVETSIAEATAGTTLAATETFTAADVQVLGSPSEDSGSIAVLGWEAPASGTDLDLAPATGVLSDQPLVTTPALHHATGPDTDQVTEAGTEPDTAPAMVRTPVT